MRTSAVILQLLSLWSLLDGTVQRTLAADQEDVPPLVLPEVKALPAYSFRGPIPEGGKINGFEISGQATRLPTSPDFLRISPPIPLSNGAVFSTSTVKSKEWVVEIALRVHGSARASSSKGGRGWAFWYTKSSSPTKGQQPAAQTHSSHDNKVSFFGQNINFDGLGIVFDSAPSAPLLPRSDPAGWAFGADSTGVISAVIDDGKTGTKWFDEDYKAGDRRYPGQEAKYLEKVVGECEAAFRNAPGLVWVRIAYFNKQIRVDLDLQPHTTLTPEKRHFTHHCFTVQDISLPSGYYFGITSLSSGNTDPDSVDVYAFDAWEVTGKADGQAHEQPAIPELEKKTGAANFRPLAGTEEVVQDLQHEGGTHPGHGGVSSVQDVIAAQLRMTEAIDALARRVDALHARLDGGSGSAGGSGNLEKQLQEISASVSRLTGQHPSQKGKDGGALTAEELEQQSVQYLVKMITRLSSDVNGITVRLDSLTTRVNKNIATIMNRVGEVFTLASRSEKLLFEKYGAGTTSKNAALGLGLGIGGITFTIVKWLGGLGACLFLLVLGDRWRRGRLSSGGGRGRKMI